MIRQQHVRGWLGLVAAGGLALLVSCDMGPTSPADEAAPTLGRAAAQVAGDSVCVFTVTQHLSCVATEALGHSPIYGRVRVDSVHTALVSDGVPAGGRGR